MEGIVQWRTVILLALGATAMASSVVALLVGKQEWDGLLLNLGTEIAGAVVTYGLFELFIGRRERQEEERARLIAQMGSDVRDVAVPAAAELRRRGWLSDGSLCGTCLVGASLSRANLTRANMSGAELLGADLRRAALQGANLQGTDLKAADLCEANLLRANLRYASLEGAELSGANLIWADLGYASFLDDFDGMDEPDMTWANLSGAELSGANLKNAAVNEEQLAQAKSLKGAIMPDGTRHD